MLFIVMCDCDMERNQQHFMATQLAVYRDNNQTWPLDLALGYVLMGIRQSHSVFDYSQSLFTFPAQLSETLFDWYLRDTQSTLRCLNSNYAPRVRSIDLQAENTAHRGKGGTSAEVHCRGFEPAFYDCETGLSYRSCFADGQPAPMHLLAGLPDAVITARDTQGQVLATKPSLISGFTKDGVFFTREQAAQLIN